MFVTKARIQRKWHHERMEYDINVPAGTRCRKITCGGTMGKFWIEDLSWIPADQGFLMHDATHYGIVLDPDEVKEVDMTSHANLLKMIEEFC